MANTSVGVRVVLEKEETFCDIHFTVAEVVDGSEVPVSGAWVELKTAGGITITRTQTDSFGKAIISDMPHDTEYRYTVSKEGYSPADGWVTTN